MKKLERRLAYYENGKIVEGKTSRKKFSTDGLIGVVALYNDGTREEESVESKVNLNKTDRAKNTAYLMFEANKQFKHDGGGTPELKALRRKA